MNNTDIPISLKEEVFPKISPVSYSVHIIPDRIFEDSKQSSMKSLFLTAANLKSMLTLVTVESHQHLEKNIQKLSNVTNPIEFCKGATDCNDLVNAMLYENESLKIIQEIGYWKIQPLKCIEKTKKYPTNNLFPRHRI
jgi:hypothetical protein